MTKKEALITALREANGDASVAHCNIGDRVGKEKALTWTRNVNGQRHPLPMDEQHERCMKELERYARKMDFHGAPDAEGEVREGGEAKEGGADDAIAKAEQNVEEQRGRIESLAAHVEGARETAEGARKESDEARKETVRAERQAEYYAKERAHATQRVKDAETEAAEQEAVKELIDAQEAEAQAEREAKENRDLWESRHNSAVEWEQRAEQFEAEKAQAEKDLEEMLEELDRAKAAEHPNEIVRFISEANRLREFVQERDNFDPFDSMRIENDGLNAIIEGDVPVDGILASLTATWGEETREQADVPTYDYNAYGEAPEGVHSAAPYVLALLKANVPVWLHGPAGTGKSTCARYAAEAMDLPYYEVNLSGSLPSAIKGRDRLKEFVEAEFCKAYAGGGVMCMEEFGFAPVQTAAVINNAIANGHFHNDASGEVIERHDDFRIVVTDNGLGNGATRDFQRNKLDGATLDRFRVGRVYVGRDERLVNHMVNGKLAAAGLDIRIGA